MHSFRFIFSTAGQDGCSCSTDENCDNTMAVCDKQAQLYPYCKVNDDACNVKGVAGILKINIVLKKINFNVEIKKSKGCACREIGRACDEGLECFSQRCRTACAIGQAGCQCDSNGGCQGDDSSIQCVSIVSEQRCVYVVVADTPHVSAARLFHLSFTILMSILLILIVN